MSDMAGEAPTVAVEQTGASEIQSLLAELSIDQRRPLELEAAE
jgi:hypothetical protein